MIDEFPCLRFFAPLLMGCASLVMVQSWGMDGHSTGGVLHLVL
jgi:hypothetical protein